MQEGVATASPTDELHDDLLLTYDKSQHPRNAVRLVYEIYFQDCPIPGASGDLISTVKETQVREPRLYFMVALWNRADHYIFILRFLLSFVFPRLISAVGDWMSAIVPHMVWP